MNKKTSHIKFIAGLLTIILVLGALFGGGYFVLDKVVVPQYFADYGINSMPDLVGMVRTLYTVPTEAEIATNAYTDSDLSLATNKLTQREYPIFSDGTFDFDAFYDGKRGNGDLYLTDRELASILDKLLDSTEFSNILPNLNHIDTLNINLLDLSITPQTSAETGLIDKHNAHIKFVLKIDTKDIKAQMAKDMDIPIFLLNMIIPETLYLTANYNVNIDNSGTKSVWKTTEGTLSVNGRKDSQSEILLDLLISFIFNKEDEMTISKLVENFGHILDQGVELLGEIEFANKLGMVKEQNGIYFLPVEKN